MTSVKAKVKPELLRWARKSAGYSVTEAARKLSKLAPERLEQWESGEDHPTIAQLRHMARIYRHPLSVFYLPEVPTDFKVMHDFRRLPGEVAGQYSPALRHELRSAQQHRELALELYREGGEPLPRFSLRTTLTDDPETVGRRVRRALDVNYAQQTAWRDPRLAFNAWRSKIEQRGVLVFQASGLPVSEMRGFSIAKTQLPVIAVNSKDAYNGRTFSLLHEFTHLMLHESGLCDMDEDFYRLPEEQRVEVFCNAVAAATLIPSEALLSEKTVSAYGEQSIEWGDDDLRNLSRRYSASREVVLRRLLTLGRTTRAFYQAKRQQFLEEYKARQEESSGFARWHQRKVSSFGKPFIRLIFDTYYQDRITLSDVSRYLGVKTKHLPDIESAVRT